MNNDERRTRVASRLTTTDNPFDPFNQWQQWFEWDRNAGYNTPNYLARIVVSSDELSEHDQDEAVEAAIDEILFENVLGIYKRVEDPDQSASVA